MRVAQIMAGAHHGGAELFFERLTVALHRAGETVLPLVRSDAERAQRLIEAGLAPQQFRFGGPFDFITRPRLAHALADFAPRVAVSWMSRATDHVPSGPWVHVGRLGGYYPLRHYRKCDHLVGNTKGLVAWFRANGWPEARTHFLPNFVADHGDATPATDLPTHLPTHLPTGRPTGLPPARPRLLALGRLHADKGFDVLIRALARLPGTTLIIAGEGPEGPSLADLAAGLGLAERVFFLGWRTDAGALLKAADIFVCPSRSEPLGNVVLEAWSAFCPVVAADADGPRELIADGSDGLLVPREDEARLAEAIAALLAAPERAAAMAAAGRRRFLAEFAEAPALAAWRRFLATVPK
ncbi:MAG TPA: glycosyltransferase [Acetobacteraceae bacterium]|nr:glycosyltransferase [Acetobacteraceae bacterium]